MAAQLGPGHVVFIAGVLISIGVGGSQTNWWGLSAPAARPATYPQATQTRITTGPADIACDGLKRRIVFEKSRPRFSINPASKCGFELFLDDADACVFFQADVNSATLGPICNNGSALPFPDGGEFVWSAHQKPINGFIRYVERKPPEPHINPNYPCDGTEQTLLLQGDVEIAFNPGGRCIVRFGFNSLVDLTDTQGRIKTITEDTKEDLSSFWPEKVKSHYGDRVEFRYMLTDE